MTTTLKISMARHSADGMSGSDAVKDVAAACVTVFSADCFTTPDSWSTETVGEKELAARRLLHGHYITAASLIPGNFEPFMERNPRLMWKAMTQLLFLLNIYLLCLLAS